MNFRTPKPTGRHARPRHQDSTSSASGAVATLDEPTAPTVGATDSANAATNTTARPTASTPADRTSDDAAAAENSYMSHREILVVLFGLMAGMLLAALDQSIVGTALPRIVSDLGGLDKLSWVVTAYLLTSTASTPLWGKISDLYGRRLIFQAAIIIFLAGSLLSGFSANMEELIGFRAVQGLGAGGLMALAFAIIGDVTRRASAAGTRGTSARSSASPVSPARCSAAG